LITVTEKKGKTLSRTHTLTHTRTSTHTQVDGTVSSGECEVAWVAQDKTVKRYAPGDVVYALVSKNCVHVVGIFVQLSVLELTLAAPTSAIQSQTDTHVVSDIVIVGIVTHCTK